MSNVDGSNVDGSYVDGFVLAVPKDKLDAYKEMSRRCGEIWKEHGALEYRECVGEDLKVKFGLPFPKLAKAKPSETIVFSWIVYPSRKVRDRCNKAVMKDPRLEDMMDPKNHPFDAKRMFWGGFKKVVEV